MAKRIFSYRLIAVIFSALLLPTSAFPHEYFFKPESFFVQVNQRIDLRLFVGEGLKKEEERPFQVEKVLSFRQYFGQIGAEAKNNQDNSMPFYSYTPGFEGNHLFARLVLGCDKLSISFELEGEVIERRAGLRRGIFLTWNDRFI